MPRIDLDILNQKQTPAFYASSLATRPAASFVGRIFIDSDSPSTGLYRDTGTAWVQIADPGAGSTGTLQQVTTNGNSTTTGITITTNGLGIGTTIPGANILDVHGTTGVLAQLENTTTNNSLLSFRNQGAGAWSVGNGYNAGANDFIIYDAVSFVNRFTIKGTGQTFVGSDTTSSGLLVVNTATSDSHIVVIGANAPSIRLRNTGTSPTLNAGFGISTATNNFIQGSASGNYCIFNASTTASPILFGVYDSGTSNTQEAARISAARNVLIGTTTDAGYKFYVNGNGYINGFTAVTGTFTNIGIGGGTVGQLSLVGAASDAWASSGAAALTFNGSNGYISTITTYQDDTSMRIGCGITQKTGLFINGQTASGGSFVSFTTGGSERLRIKTSGVLNISSIPTSSAGLSSGDIYSNLGILTIVP